jgi:hypothetical protein
MAHSLPSARLSLGSNAATMALRAAVEGCDVTLGAAVGPRLQSMLSPNVAYVGPASMRDGNFTEDVHLVLEYQKGASWRGFTAPRANRCCLPLVFPRMCWPVCWLVKENAVCWLACSHHIVLREQVLHEP